MSDQEPRTADVQSQGRALPEAMDALKMLRILIRAAQRHSALIEKHCGISGAQLWALQEVNESPGLRIGDVAERMAIHQTTASNLIDGLVKKKCLDKLRDPADSRVTKLVLTRHGRSVLKCAPVAARGLLPDALAKMDREELQHLIKGLEALLRAVDTQESEAAFQLLSFNT